MAKTLPSPSRAPRASDPVSTPLGTPRRVVITVWPSREGRFLAHAELPNGTRLAFDSQSALLRFLGDSTASTSRSPGLR